LGEKEGKKIKNIAVIQEIERKSKVLPYDPRIVNRGRERKKKTDDHAAGFERPSERVYLHARRKTLSWGGSGRRGKKILGRPASRAKNKDSIGEGSGRQKEKISSRNRTGSTREKARKKKEHSVCPHSLSLGASRKAGSYRHEERGILRDQGFVYHVTMPRP